MGNSYGLDRFYAKNILKELGEFYSISSLYDYDEPSYYSKYDGYGLEIRATTDDKKNIQNISILFYGREVYTDERATYVEGAWEDVLKEIYTKIPVIQKNREEARQQNVIARQLYKDVLSDLFNSRIRNINSTLRLKKYDTYDPNGGYGNTTTYHEEVLKNDEVVFHYETLGTSTFIAEYKPGAWENEIRGFHQKYKNHETESERNEAIKQLRKLREI
jgi:hypothetical protein